MSRSVAGRAWSRVCALGMIVGALAAGAATARAEEAAKADTLGWRKELVGSFNFTQSSFSNWAGGGVNNSAWLTGARGAFKRIGTRANWTHNLRCEYGQMKEKGRGSRKTFDLIFAESILDLNSSRLIKPYARASAKSQFATGYNYDTTPRTPLSDFADPLYLTQGAGVGFQFKPYLITRWGLGLQETFARKYGATYTKGHSSLVEGGVESVTELNRTVRENLGLKSRLSLFWPFNETSRLDVDWMTDITLKAIGALGVTFKCEALYNKTVLDKIQWQQVLGIGITYSFL